MVINKIKLSNFRNYENQEIEFDKGINIIYGDNAQGKTNIIEAIFVGSLGKSFRTNKDRELININKDRTKVEIYAEKEDRKINVKYEIGENKRFYINDIEVNKISDVLGNVYAVLFVPEDISILKNEPSRRRRFLNIIISQLRPIYVHILNQYNKTLEQRNSYLKQIKFEGKQEDMLDIWDEQLVKLGIKIYNYRKEFIEKINNKIKNIHLQSTDNKENVEIIYNSNVKEEEYLSKVKGNRKEDIQKGYTSIGVHRDDFNVYINSQEISIYGSQGQKRTTIISLKLAEAEVIYDEIGERPVMLLDDFMSELDKKRIQGFLENIQNNQVIITCTDSFSIPNTEYNLYKITNANVETIAKK